MALKDRMGWDTEPLYLVDGAAFIYRAFYAFQDMRRSDGVPTNALYTVVRIMLKLLREERPVHLAFFLDGKGPTFRHEVYEPYKANRSATPEDLVAQIEPIKEALALMGVPVEVSKGVEADDCIASLAARHRDRRPVVIVGMDKDLRQCLAENVVMWDPGAKTEKVTTLEDFRTETGLEPGQWADFQALVGDSSDNIPGAPGVGPKTALKIMAEHPTLEAIRDNLDALPTAQHKKIAPDIDKLFTYRLLTTLRTDACDLDPEDLVVRDLDLEGLRDFLQAQEFRSLLRDLPQPETSGDAAPTKAGGQLSLLGDEAPARQATPVAACGDPAALDLTDRPLGLALREGALTLGLDGAAHVYCGDVQALARALGSAKGVYADDLKALWRAHPALDALPLDRWLDLGLAAYCLNPEERDYSLPAIARRMQSRVEDAGPALAEEAPGLAALRLGRALETDLAAAGLEGLMRKLEMPLIPVLADMERLGVAIDKEAFGSFRREVEAELETLTARIHEQAGRAFNQRSSQQLAEVLFDTLGLKPRGKTPGGQPSTSHAVLEKMQGEHPIVDAILDYRRLEKLRSTYLEPLPRLADDHGRIHTTFNNLATATGRLSSSAPNLQNIPIRGQDGPRMRACFTAAPGHRLVAADYSQIELRILAHMSQAPALVEAFKNDEDIHAKTAALVHGKALAEVGPDERRGAKAVNFGLIYGMGRQKLAQDLGITTKEAGAFIDRYFERLEGLKDFFEAVEAAAMRESQVHTLAGRRRLLPDLHSRNNQLQAQAKRQALNTVIQGSAADVIKIAMLDVASDEPLRDMGARLILQVHDELLLEAPEDVAEAAGERLAGLMAAVAEGVTRFGQAQPLSVPLKVDWGVGVNWAEAH